MCSIPLVPSPIYVAWRSPTLCDSRNLHGVSGVPSSLVQVACFIGGRRDHACFEQRCKLPNFGIGTFFVVANRPRPLEAPGRSSCPSLPLDSGGQAVHGSQVL